MHLAPVLVPGLGLHHESADPDQDLDLGLEIEGEEDPLHHTDGGGIAADHDPVQFLHFQTEKDMLAIGRIHLQEDV